MYVNVRQWHCLDGLQQRRRGRQRRPRGHEHRLARTCGPRRTQSQQKNDSGDLVTTTESIDASGCIASDVGSAKIIDGIVALLQNDQKLVANAGYEDNLTDMYDLPSLVIHWLQSEVAPA